MNFVKYFNIFKLKPTNSSYSTNSVSVFCACYLEPFRQNFLPLSFAARNRALRAHFASPSLVAAQQQTERAFQSFLPYRERVVSYKVKKLPLRTGGAKVLDDSVREIS
ncbi:MAG: hypothetical protein IJ171_00365 [Ruminococcus sp.]|nr:hypothetical protein [Ruminococcus sp.]